MRSYPPLGEDHPAIHFRCGICGERLGVGAVTTLVPSLAGGICEAKVSHVRCLPPHLLVELEPEGLDHG